MLKTLTWWPFAPREASQTSPPPQTQTQTPAPPASAPANSQGGMEPETRLEAEVRITTNSNAEELDLYIEQVQITARRGSETARAARRQVTTIQREAVG